MKKLTAVLLLTSLLFLTAPAEQVATEYTPEELYTIWYQVVALMRERGIYPYVELRQGDTGYEVLFLQARLARLNYYGKDLSPRFGSGTHAAMRLFERVNQLHVNGVASIEDQKLLFTDHALPNPGVAVGLNKGQTPDPANWNWPSEPPEWWASPQWPPATPSATAENGFAVQTPTPGLQTAVVPTATGTPVSATTPTPGPLVTGITIHLPDLSTNFPFSTGLLFPTSTPSPTSFHTIKPELLKTPIPQLKIPGFP